MLPVDDAPTKDEAWKDDCGERIFQRLNAGLLPQLENQLPPDACTLWESSPVLALSFSRCLISVGVKLWIGGRHVDCGKRQIVVFNLPNFNPRHLSRV
jgi:hypothetical protein